MKPLVNPIHSSPEPQTKPRVDVWVNDPFLMDLYRPAFEKHLYDWHWEINPNDWKLLLKTHRPTFLILDLSMFAEKPIEALQEIKSLSPLTAIIVLSHTEDVDVAISAFKCGVNDYYRKPTNPETLLYAVQKFFSQKALLAPDPIMQADLEMFGVTHHISIAESASKMRELAVNHLLSSLGARGAIWLCPLSAPLDNSTSFCHILNGSTFALEHWGFHSSKEALNELSDFQKDYPLHIRDSFYTNLTSHPEHWFRKHSAWIPMKNAAMGGLLLFGITRKVTSTLVTRSEFLIRSLEISLENQQRYIEAKQLSYIDDLTGLYNPRFLDQALSIAMDNLKSSSKGFCVLFIDIDKFKQINDQNGHLIGSQMLSHLGKLLKNSFRRNDQLFRYGGDEFIAVLYDTEIEKAREIAERIRKTVEERIFKFHHSSLKVTLSIGIARFPEHGRSKEEVIAMADRAMYVSKKQGRNQVIIAIPEDHA
jgi:diguanylate cyclase (GGDEF)-like protein